MTHWLIVGGGTSGCVLAGRLSEDTDSHVTLVEAGPAEAGPSSASYLDDLAAADALWPGLVVSDGDDAQRAYPQGRGLGGSSAINGMVLSGSDLPQYEGWGWTGLVAARRNVQIPTEVVPLEQLGPVDRALLGSARDGQRATLSRATGIRVSTADAYLTNIRKRRNLDVLTDTIVARVLTNGKKASGVVTAAGDRLEADQVVCSAGSIHTPALLLRSGIDVDGVGDGLTDHPSRIIEIALKPDSSADPQSLVTGAAVRRGPVEVMAMNHLGRDRPAAGALFVGLLVTSRRGSVRLDPLAADDPTVSPVVDFGRLDDVDDVRGLADGVTLAQRLLASRSFATIIDGYTVGSGYGGYAHASSSCRMGTVVDQRGAVNGYDGLFICDASVFPEIPASGTYLPVVLLAERLAALWCIP